MNSATNYAFAAGRRAKANHTGAFVWADSTAADFASTSTNQFIIRASSGVGIGEPNPGAALDVRQATNRVALFNRTGDDGVLVNWQRDGQNVGSITIAAGVVSYNAFSGSHYAWTPQTIAHGQLVSMTGENRRSSGRVGAEIIYGVEVTQQANDPRCLGSYLGLEEPRLPASDDNAHQISSVGNGEMWVTETSSGDISPGDFFVSSAVAGCAMKDDPAQFPVGHIVARAAEEVKWHEIKANENQVKCAKISVLFENFERHGNGVALAAIQDLNQKVEEQRSENGELKRRLAELEELLSRLTAKND